MHRTVASFIAIGLLVSACGKPESPRERLIKDLTRAGKIFISPKDDDEYHRLEEGLVAETTRNPKEIEEIAGSTAMPAKAREMAAILLDSDPTAGEVLLTCIKDPDPLLAFDAYLSLAALRGRRLISADIEFRADSFSRRVVRSARGGVAYEAVEWLSKGPTDRAFKDLGTVLDEEDPTSAAFHAAGLSLALKAEVASADIKTRRRVGAAFEAHESRAARNHDSKRAAAIRKMRDDMRNDWRRTGTSF